MAIQHFHWCGAKTLGEWSVAPIMRTSYHVASTQSGSTPKQHVLVSAEVHPVGLVFVKKQEETYVGWVLGDDSSAVSTFLKSQEKGDETGL